MSSSRAKGLNIWWFIVSTSVNYGTTDTLSLSFRYIIIVIGCSVGPWSFSGH